MSDVADAVAGTISDLFGTPTEEAPEEVQPVQETEVAEEESLPDWEAASRDLFTEDEEDEPDFSALADEELSTAETEDLAPNEFDDETTAKLKREALAAKKRAEHYERLHLTTARKGWEADVRSQPWGEFLPDDLSTVKAASRRDFNRQVKAIAKANYTVLKPHIEKLQAERNRLKEAAKTEARQEVQQAWGRPTIGNVRVPDTPEQVAGSKLERARQSRSLLNVTKAMIEGDLI